MLNLTENSSFFLMAGPNVIQNEAHCLKMARAIKEITDRLGITYIFKTSFDKANRTSISSYRGVSLEEGMRVLQKVKEEVGVPVITDIHEASQAAIVGQVADIIQIPAFLCRQTDLLMAAGKTGRWIQIKKGQFCGPEVMAHSANKIRTTGNDKIIVCERGSMFGYNDLIVDPRNIVAMRDSGALVSVDITHSLQQPGRKSTDGGVAAGGLREMIPTIGRTAVAVGVDGIFMEVHDNPESSPCDAPTQWPLDKLEPFLKELLQLHRVTRGRQTQYV